MTFLNVKCAAATSRPQARAMAYVKTAKSTVTLPRIDDEVRADLFNRGNYFRMKYEFDRAASAYEHIIAQDSRDAEAHFCLALCHYGVEYVRDPRTGDYKPTCHKASFQSIREDIDYRQALEYAEGRAADLYRYEGDRIHQIQQEILEISRREAPYDVFISYKESTLAATDPDGRGRNDGSRTPDSVLAQDIYDALTERGLRVFFSRVSLEDKLGSAYEPYIFSALHSARVMLLVATRKEYVDAVWVRNEWKRYLELSEGNRNQTLIPVIGGSMDEFDLPDELAALNLTQNMNATGAMQDLIRGVLKLTDHLEDQTTVVRSQDMEELAWQQLEAGHFEEATQLAEQLLNISAENPQGYLIKLLAQTHAESLKELLTRQDCAPEESLEFSRLLRYATGDLAKEVRDFQKYRTIRKSYQQGLVYLQQQKYAKAEESFWAAEDYEDAPSMAAKAGALAEEARQLEKRTKALAEYNQKARELDAKAEALFRERHADLLDKSGLLKRKAQDQARKKPGIKLCLLGIIMSVMGLMIGLDLWMHPELVSLNGLLQTPLQGVWLALMYIYCYCRISSVMKHFGVPAIGRWFLGTFISLFPSYLFFGPLVMYERYVDDGNYIGIYLFMGLMLLNLLFSILWQLRQYRLYRKGIQAAKESEQFDTVRLVEVRAQIRDELIHELNAQYEPLIGSENLRTFQ